MSETIRLKADGETAAQSITTVLTRRGFSVARSFDLRSALASLEDYACHGTAACTCQFVVLLVYGQATQPVGLTIHGRDGQAQVGLAAGLVGRPDPELTEGGRGALIEAVLTGLVPVVVSEEAGAWTGWNNHT